MSQGDCRDVGDTGAHSIEERNHLFCAASRKTNVDQLGTVEAQDRLGTLPVWQFSSKKGCHHAVAAHCL